MDPFSTEGELINIHTHFHQAQYQAVIDYDTTPFSAENALPARLLQLRARIAQGSDAADAVATELEHELKDTGTGTAGSELRAALALALVASGRRVSDGIALAERLVSEVDGPGSEENGAVLILLGSALVGAGRLDEALALLAKHQGNSEYYGGTREMRGVWLMIMCVYVWSS
jgi:coatomer protein complex subunit epsilon